MIPAWGVMTMYPSSSSPSEELQLCSLQAAAAAPDAGPCWVLEGLRGELVVSGLPSSLMLDLRGLGAGLFCGSEVLDCAGLTFPGLSLFLGRQRFEAQRPGCWLWLEAGDPLRPGRARRARTVSRMDSWICWARAVPTHQTSEPRRTSTHRHFSTLLLRLHPDFPGTVGRRPAQLQVEQAVQVSEPADAQQRDGDGRQLRTGSQPDQHQGGGGEAEPVLPAEGLGAAQTARFH